MPNHRYHSKVRQVKCDILNGKSKSVFKCKQNDKKRIDLPQSGTKARCCFPNGCSERLIDLSDTSNAVKIFCNNTECEVGKWMHSSCFELWEKSIINHLRSCNKAKNRNDQQGLKSVLSKKAHHLIYKPCLCGCRQDVVSKDENNSKADPESCVKKKQKKKLEKFPIGTFNRCLNNNKSRVTTPQLLEPDLANDNDNQFQLFDSKIATNNLTPINQSMFDILIENRFKRTCNSISKTEADTSNLFSKAVGSTRVIKSWNINYGANDEKSINLSYEIPNSKTYYPLLCSGRNFQMLSDAPLHDNDAVKQFIYSYIYACGLNLIECSLCNILLPIYDGYPIIDGTLFLSPNAHSGVILPLMGEDLLFLKAVCVNCLEGFTDIRCCFCKSKWDGSIFREGTIYLYDIFAALPCCQKRLTCKICKRSIIELTPGLPFFGQYSSIIKCPFCNTVDTHLVKPLNQIFSVKFSESWWKFMKTV